MATGQTPSEVEEVERAEALAASLWQDAAARRSRRESRRSARTARLLADDAGRTTILALTDEVLRIHSNHQAAAVLAQMSGQEGNILHDWRAAPYLNPLDRAAFVAAGRLGPRMADIVVPLARRRVLAELAGVILPSDPARLDRHIARRRDQGMRLNINVLGEAVLGEAEAEARLEHILAVLARPSVEHVSVKISAICSQLDPLAFDHEAERIAGRLRRLYRAAASYRPAKFVNLDMEEYADLELTAEVFRRVLDEPEFAGLEAGLVLQAYLPDSTPVLAGLCQWAVGRVQGGAAGIRVRLVKGANLAMETVEAEMQRWLPAPFADKGSTDANYKRMLDLALDPAHDGAVRVGVATHNVFDVAWAAVRAETCGASHRVEFEMLEGMSPALAEAVAARLGGLLLYAPVVADQDLPAAIAYLLRRLDENSATDNFLAHQFDLSVGSRAWADQAARFRASVEARTDPVPPPRRDRPLVPVTSGTAFDNSPATDFTRPANRAWAVALIEKARASSNEYGPLIDGARGLETSSQDGMDPSSGSVAYRWGAASIETVDAAVAAARAGREAWRGADRAAVLRGAASALAAARGRLLGVMAVDGGKTLREGDPEVSEAVDFANYYAGSVPSPESGFEPYGTVVVASPWNFPLSIPAGGVLAALAAGNTVILKPAPETVAVAAELAETLWSAGVPQSALQFVPTLDDDAGRRLITHPDVDGVILTGSYDTARMFLDWRPDLNLHAETSGKNAIVVTATADVDQAIADIVHSAFGHAGQKCSAASLVILEAQVYDDGRFLTRLADAVGSVRVGPAWSPSSRMGPLIRPPSGPLAEALSGLEAGERWLVQPSRLTEFLWSPGLKAGVAPGSPFHLTECFGPVLGVMRGHDLDQAIAWQNGTDFGLTAGLQALDPLEIDHWRARAGAGNLYVNRGITGAVVRRQPFGGWKRSVVGPGAKAGGPNYVASLGRWPSGSQPGSFEAAWKSMAAPSDPSGLRAESNVFRYRPLSRVALVPGPGRGRALAAAAAVGASVTEVSAPVDADPGFDKIRILAPDPHLLRAAYATGVWVDATPVAADDQRELQRWVREQAVSESRHRHGNLTARRPGLLPVS